ncbi:MAG: ParB/RepB/Spo0J family partition protein, partial [Burkholderiales bacterium]
NSIHASVTHELADAKRRLTEFDGAILVQRLEPKTVHRSQFANRIEDEYKTPEFRQLKLEIENAGGNVQPIKVRPVTGSHAVLDGQAPQYEIAYGHRRNQACLELGIHVNAIIDESLSDADLFEAMDRENRGRKNLSAWEQGCAYRDAIAKGLYPSERRLAERLGANPSDVNRSIQLAKLPKDVIAAFSSPLDLQVRWQKPLTDALQRDPEGVLSRARSLVKNRGSFTPAQVLEQLIGRVEAVNAATEIVVDGKPAGTLRVDSKGRVIIEIPPRALPVGKHKALLKLLSEFLVSK